MPSPSEPSASHRAAEEAFAFWPDAFGLALVLVGDHGRAEELAGEAFLRLLRSKRPLDTSRSLRPLVLTTVRNLALNDLRKKRPESLEVAREAGHEPLELDAASPHASLARTERRDAVQAALRKLSPRWSEMVYLRDGLGASYREIATVTETSEDVVRTTLSRARARLRELLAPFAPQSSAASQGPAPSTAGGTTP